MSAVEKSLQEKILGLIAERRFGHDPETGRLTGVVCEACGSEALELFEDASGLSCGACGDKSAEPLAYLFRQPAMPGGPASETRRALEAETRSGRAEPGDGLIEEAEAAVRREDRAPRQTRADRDVGSSVAPRAPLGEKVMIAVLAMVFLAVGLLAAAMSGFANYLAFGNMVDDPLQSRVWAWTGVIACVCSFGGFTFVYWHGAQKRFGEAFRAGVIALAGAATSLVGTHMYMEGQAQGRFDLAEAAGARAGVLEAQIEDWRRALAAIPNDVRSVEGLEAYIAEVERVGRTHERPYRLALDELGQARRRADLQGRIEHARSELGELTVAALPAAQTRGREERLRSVFFATMLEVFSSQGTSIGFVALMVLVRRRGHPEGTGATS